MYGNVDSDSIGQGFGRREEVLEIEWHSCESKFCKQLTYLASVKSYKVLNILVK